ncbi:MAG: hypothetical protein HY814_13105 [Candidatus Riflebacteria bacterium]|nr:hypothetical protein [Candidatus Riflebacteria bacterium]
MSLAGFADGALEDLEALAKDLERLAGARGLKLRGRIDNLFKKVHNLKRAAMRADSPVAGTLDRFETELASMGGSTGELPAGSLARLEALLDEARGQLAAEYEGLTLRVGVRALDRLMVGLEQLTGWQLLMKAHLNRAGQSNAANGRGAVWRMGADRLLHELEERLDSLEQAVAGARLVSARNLLEPLKGKVRAWAREQHREVRLVVQGAAVSGEKLIMDRLGKVLDQLVPNAIVHGVESPSERVALGKKQCGELEVRFEQTSAGIVLEVEDDGRGIDREKLKAHAPGESLADDAASFELLFRPGFSTSDQADLSSGRGYGMSAVRTGVEEMQGSLSLENHPGAGLKIRVEVPNRLARTECLLARAGLWSVALPVSYVESSLAPRSGSSPTVGPSEGSVQVECRRLEDLLAERPPEAPAGPSDCSSRPHVLLRDREARLALEVDQVLEVARLVVRPLPAPISQSEDRLVLGAAVAPPAAGAPAQVRRNRPLAPWLSSDPDELVLVLSGPALFRLSQRLGTSTQHVTWTRSLSEQDCPATAARANVPSTDRRAASPAQATGGLTDGENPRS